MKISRGFYLKKIKNSLSKKKVTFLIGARRVGKTTIMKEFKNTIDDNLTLYFSFDDIISIPKFTSTKDFLNYISIKSKKDLNKIKYFFLDEVQNIQNIEIILKDIVDNYTSFYVLASGSGSFEIFHNIKESLMGRKSVIYVYPVKFFEFLKFKGENLQKWKEQWYPELFLEKKDLIEEFLIFGGYPSVICASSYEDKYLELKNIIDTWLDIDIRLILTKEEFINFKPSIELIAQSVGSLIKVDSIAKDLGINTYKLKKILHIIQKSFLIDFIEPFSKKRTYEIKSNKKAYFLDTGILNYLNKNFNLNHNYKGKVIENFVFTELLKKKKEHQEIKFWRTKNGSEIDFLILDILKSSLDIVEVKAKSCKVIPKNFNSIIDLYGTEIRNIFLSNENIFLKRNLESGKKITEIKFIPYIFISE